MRFTRKPRAVERIRPWSCRTSIKCCLTRNGIYLGSVEDEEGDGACLETN